MQKNPLAALISSAALVNRRDCLRAQLSVVRYAALTVMQTGNSILHANCLQGCTFERPIAMDAQPSQPSLNVVPTSHLI